MVGKNDILIGKAVLFFEKDGELCSLSFSKMEEVKAALTVLYAFGYSIKEKTKNAACYESMKFLLTKET